jgi:TM2 domain-containing membrane protein YozV
VPPKDPTVAVLLALVLGFFGIFGIGHIYVGQLVRGIIFLVTGIALAFLVVVGSFFLVCGLPFLIIGFVVWIFQAIDAHRLANEYNDVLRRTGRPPW